MLNPLRIALLLAVMLTAVQWHNELGGQTINQIRLLEETKVADDGLYFSNYHFSPRITPHGDCIDVVNGYIFVTWYKGGMDDRHLMLSRMKIGTGKWMTIQFPHQLTGYRQDPTIGDSHCTAAIGVCTIDNTVHLLYDMHSYNKHDLPNDYFNYSVSKAEAAFVPDEQWTLDLFYPKRDYLKAGVNYEDATYPNLFRRDDGSLIAIWRYRGSGNGDHYYSFYDGQNWSGKNIFNNGNQTAALNRYSIYGGAQYLNDTFYWGFSIRYSNRDDPPLNVGLYFASGTAPFGPNDWQDVNGEPIALPIQNPDIIKIGEPTALGIGNYTSSGPSWTVTANGAIHFIATVNQTNVHYYKGPEDKDFSYTLDTPRGNLYSIGSWVLLAGTEGDHPKIMVTPAGKNQWQTLYQETTGPVIRYYNTAMDGQQLVYYLMEKKSGESQPLWVMRYQLDISEDVDHNRLELLDNFDDKTGTLDQATGSQIPNGTLGGIWDASAETISGYGQGCQLGTQDGSQAVNCKSLSTGDGRGACFSGINDAIEPDERGLFFFRFMIADTNSNPVSFHIGLHTLTGTDPLEAADLDAIVAGFAAVSDGGSRTEPYRIMTLDRGTELKSGLQRNQWYAVWMVVNNPKNRYDLYLRPADGPALKAGQQGDYPELADRIAVGLPFNKSIDFPITGGMWVQAQAASGLGQTPWCWLDEFWWCGHLDVPVIVEQPSDCQVKSGQSGHFQVRGVSLLPLTYQWYKTSDNTTGTRDDDIMLASGPDYVIPSTGRSDGGYYYCTVSDGDAVAVSHTVSLKLKQETAHWTLDLDDFADGQYKDVSGAGHHAAVIDRPSFIPGQVGEGVRLSGEDENSFQAGQAQGGRWNPLAEIGQMTVSFWVMWDGPTGDYQCLIAKRDSWDSTGTQWQIMAGRTDDGLRIQSRSGSVIAENALADSIGQWQHYCVSYDGEQASIYKNGLEISAGEFQMGNAPDAQLTLGYNSGGEAFNGALDEIRIYNYALNAKEAAALYYGDSGIPVCLAETRPHYDFNGDCVVDMQDLARLLDAWLDCGWIPDCTQNTAPLLK